MEALSMLGTTLLLVSVCVWTARGARQHGQDPCYVGQKQMYHAYPDDKSLYIQCDHFGQMYVRHCNSGSEWSDSDRTCVSTRRNEPAATYTVYGKSRAQSKSTMTYSPKSDSATTQSRYAETRYGAPANTARQIDYMSSPLTAYLLMLAGQAQHGYGLRSNAKPAVKSSTGAKKVSHASHPIGYSDPYQYYYGYMPNQRGSMSMGYDTPDSASFGTSNYNAYHYAGSAAPRKAYSAPYGPAMVYTHGTPYGSNNMAAFGARHNDAINAYYGSSQRSTGPMQKSEGNIHGSSLGAGQGEIYSVPHSHQPSENPYGMSYGSAHGSGPHTPHSATTHTKTVAMPHAPAPVKSIHRSKGKSAQVHSHHVVKPVESSSPLSVKCSADSSVRYMADPTSDKHYYECAYHHNLVRRVCGGATIWVQPLRMCADVTDKLSTAAPSMSPCVATDSRYVPYPTDPSKYIKCRTWHDVVVLKCHPHEIWVQEQQKCMNTHALQPVMSVPQPHPQPTAARPAVHRSQPCDDTSFYYANPGDNTKYIQCDEAGHAVTMPCHSTTVWDDDIKTCVLNLGYEPQTIPAIMQGNTHHEYDFSQAQPLNINEYDTRAAPQYTDMGGDAKMYAYTSGQFGQYSAGQRCEGDDLWVPSMEVCASIRDAKNSSEYCHEGDYYFPKYHICATVISSNREGTSFTSTDYDSYISPPPQSSSEKGYQCPVKVKTQQSNVCGVNNTYYFPFPENNTCFIQCDQLNVMYVMSCPPKTIWNQEAVACVLSHHEQVDAATYLDYGYHDYYGDVLTMRNSGKSLYSNSGTGGSSSRVGQSGDKAGALSHLCESENQGAYKAHPTDIHKFIVCINDMAYPMPCPRNSRWRQDILTCFWPTRNGVQ